LTVATADQVAKENADVIIMDDNFSTIINVAKWGRSVYINIQKFVQFQLTVNVVALMVNFVSASFTGAHNCMFSSTSFLSHLLITF
jgi:Ca2+-transporting ATPase